MYVCVYMYVFRLMYVCSCMYVVVCVYVCMYLDVCGGALCSSSSSGSGSGMIADQYEAQEDTVWAPVMGEARVVVVAAAVVVAVELHTPHYDC